MLKLYCAWYCPFAQRAWMGLLHKALAFEYIEVDPFRETEWWLKISRGRSTVPVIVTQDDPESEETTIIDSTRIVEYLDDLVPDVHPLYPATPNEKAEARFWIDHVNERVVPNIYRFLGADKPGEDRDKSRAALLEGMQTLVETMSATGPYFYGSTISAMDLVLVPFAYRIDALLGHYRDFSLPEAGAAWSNYHRWYGAMCETDMFRKSATDHADYRSRLIKHYLPYSQGKH